MKSATQKRRQAGQARLASQQRGFTLVELLIATVVFLVGVVLAGGLLFMAFGGPLLD